MRVVDLGAAPKPHSFHDLRPYVNQPLAHPDALSNLIAAIRCFSIGNTTMWYCPETKRWDLSTFGNEKKQPRGKFNSLQEAFDYLTGFPGLDLEPLKTFIEMSNQVQNEKTSGSGVSSVPDDNPGFCKGENLPGNCVMVREGTRGEEDGERPSLHP